GYTDNTGADARNLSLSKDRAASVLKALTGTGIESNRLSSEGFGSASPIGDNASEEGKAKNRRVELVKK
ncbi:MAG: OmpA family protein, partial [Sphingobacteriales bacterium]